MLSAASVRRRSARVTRGLFSALATGFLTLLSVPLPVYAETPINVEVRDGTPASLTITTNLDGQTVSQPTVIVEGTVHNVTQIVAYVDNVYNTSLPLALGASTFTIALGVAPGTHEVRLEGLDAYTNTSVSQTVTFTYTPPSTNGGSSTTTDTETATTTSSPSTVSDYFNDTIDAAKATQADAANQVRQASSSGPLSSLSDITFSAFKSIDLISTTDGTGVNKMAGRFTLVSAGLAATVFPWAVYSFVDKLRFIPKLAMTASTATVSTRIVGLILMSIPFLFMH